MSQPKDFMEAVEILKAQGNIGIIENQQSNNVELSIKLAQALVSKMSVKEKVYLQSGHWSVVQDLIKSKGRVYNAYAINGGGCKRLGVPSIRFSDGPRGVVMGKSTCFPTATVRAAERSGHITLSLESIILYKTQLDVLRKRLVSASVYPCALLVIGCLVTLFLLGYVVPRFSAVFDSSQRDLPWLSAALIATGRTFNDHWEWVVLGGAVVLGSLVFAVIRWRRQVGHAILSAPWLSQRAHEFQMARFYHAVSLLLGAGVPLASALGMTKDLLGPKLKSTLDNTREAVEQGQSFSAALSKCNLLDPVSASLIKVGEKSGQLAEMLHRTARFADDEFARRIDWASRLLEPLLMVALGIVIGTVVVLLYLPIFELAGSMQ